MLVPAVNSGMTPKLRVKWPTNKMLAVIILYIIYQTGYDASDSIITDDVGTKKYKKLGMQIHDYEKNTRNFEYKFTPSHGWKIFYNDKNIYIQKANSKSFIKLLWQKNTQSFKKGQNPPWDLRITYFLSRWLKSSVANRPWLYNFWSCYFRFLHRM